MEYMIKGGPIMWPLLLLSIAALAVIIERWWVLRKAKINVNAFLAKVRKALIVNKSIRDAIKVCEQYRGPVASIMKAGLLKYGQPKEDIEKTIETAAMYEMSRLERRLAVLASVANVAPLLGFFGTVTGMIRSFDALAEAGLSNPGLVAAGISEALITTASGLAVAIPVQLAYNYFTSQINKSVRDIETSTNMLLETFGEMQRSGIAPDHSSGSSAAAASGATAGAKKSGA
ncbi:MAG: MotA/TolQ/ExbB proton channel family protein [Acidobacteria bacterium]|nr:MAG: MotA/TolQ/ExbB proton channel family protein [Acidobacteriota bacterium]